MAVKAMELGVQYVISLNVTCCSKRWKDLLLRNKFGETVFFWGGVYYFGRHICISLFLIHSVIADGYGKLHREFVSKSSPIMHLAKSEVQTQNSHECYCLVPSRSRSLGDI